jgi:hypothetical protein
MNTKLTDKVRKLKVKLSEVQMSEKSTASVQTEEDLQQTIDELRSQVNSLKKKT